MALVGQLFSTMSHEFNDKTDEAVSIVLIYVSVLVMRQGKRNHLQCCDH